MKKVAQKRALKSQKKIKMLILLMMVTAILSITATYAWFSTQRDVEITGMRLNVEVAESMQISLDGETWTQSVVIKDMKQFYGTYSGTGDSVAIYQAKSVDDGGNENYVPTELLPVSSSGTVTEGKLQFVTGTVYTGSTGKTGLKEITACSEADLTATAAIGDREDNNSSHPFLVFDMYLRNISAKADGELDVLKLNIGSRVWVDTASTTDYEGAGKAGTGLEYSARVAFIPYNNTVSVTATESGGKTVGEQVRELTADNSEKVAIWEPNDLEHTPYVVSNNNMGITQTSQAVSTLTIKDSLGGTTADIDDVYDTTDTTNLATPITMKPEYTLTTGTTVAAELTATDGTTKLGLKPNTISKVRCYIWLEGQDPDCIDMASTGDKLNANIKLVKDKTTTTDQITYTDETNTGNASEITAEDYGGVVTNYEASNGANVDWKIFYADEDNIYLIADDYVENSKVPAGKGGTAVNAGSFNTTYCFYPADIVTGTDYAGTSDWNTNIADKWLSQYTYTSTDYHAKATAYLLDTGIWSGFKDSSGYADYAVGGPTLELFTASYNQTHTTKTIDTRVAQSTNDSSYGYQLKWSTEEWADNAYGGLAVDGMDYTESLYIIGNNDRAVGYWVASPSAGNADCVMAAAYLAGGGIAVLGDTYYDYAYLGARPLVSLKSSVTIEKQGDGTYKIVE